MPPQDKLSDLLSFIPKLKEGSIVAISSKVISICEGHTIPANSITHEELVTKLAGSSLEPIKRGANDMVLTQVGNVLVESAGVDISNADNYYVLLPRNPFKSAKEVWQFLRKRDHIKRLGVVITDSHSVPRRQGAIGFALASYGFKATHVYEDEKDIFGHKFHFTAADVADSVAASAVLVMGEGNEQTPVALISKLDGVDFFKRTLPLATVRKYAWVHPDLDVYTPLLNSKLWHSVRK